jgi:hypothetical protein
MLSIWRHWGGGGAHLQYLPTIESCRFRVQCGEVGSSRVLLVERRLGGRLTVYRVRQSNPNTTARKEGSLVIGEPHLVQLIAQRSVWGEGSDGQADLLVDDEVRLEGRQDVGVLNRCDWVGCEILVDMSNPSGNGPLALTHSNKLAKQALMGSEVMNVLLGQTCTENPGLGKRSRPRVACQRNKHQSEESIHRP